MFPLDGLSAGPAPSLELSKTWPPRQASWHQAEPGTWPTLRCFPALRPHLPFQALSLRAAADRRTRFRPARACKRVQRTAGGHQDDKRRTEGPQAWQEDTSRVQGSPAWPEDSRTTAGHLEDKKRITGGQRPGTRFRGAAGDCGHYLLFRIRSSLPRMRKSAQGE